MNVLRRSVEITPRKRPLVMVSAERPLMVESRCGAVALGSVCLLPPLSSDGALARIIHEQIKEIKQKPRMCENDV